MRGAIVAVAFCVLAACVDRLDLRQPAPSGSFRKSITIARALVGTSGAPLTIGDHPFLFSSIDPDLRSVASGGHVASGAGWDITFYAFDAETCGGPSTCRLDHELERYDPLIGETIAWVRIPSLRTASATTNTVLYIVYGDSGVTSPTANPPAVWGNAFAAVFHLSGALPEARDSTLNANDGIGSGGVVQEEGPIGGALSFDGVDGEIAGPNDESLSLHEDVTVSLWVRLDSIASDPTMVAYGNAGDDSSSTNHLYNFFHNGTLVLGHEEGAGNDVYPGSGPSTPLGVWTHLVAARNAAGNEVSYYIDGTFGGKKIYPFAPSGGETAILWLARDGDGFFLDGALDEVRITGRIRSPHEIKTEFHNQSDPATFFTVGAEESL